ncbi:hypothetical protein DL96DRAFT_1617525 [Flagelloscypha sp. PMI_526]|nr:hypothetical protein DL96DRAFT_1617525 [Flagelloscypha sp. PMI_526]
MAFRTLVHAVKPHSHILCLIVYLLVGILPFIIWSRNSDPIPDFIASHPEITFTPVSRFYGPGAWLALILGIISGTATLLHAAFTNPQQQTWTPEVIAVALYCLASCWNLRRMQHAIQGAEGRLGVSLLPALTAANRAAIFSGGVLEVYAILLLPRIFNLKTKSSPRRATIIQLVLAWISSIIPIFVILPDTNSKGSTFSTDFPCLETDSTCQSGRQLVRTYVFFSQSIATIPVPLLRTFWDFYASFDPGVYFITFGIYGVTAVILTTVVFLPDWIRGLRWGTSIGVITALVLPMLIWAVTVFVSLVLFHPVVCVVQFGTILALAAIPRSGVFPYSGISMREVEQSGLLLIVTVYYLIRGMTGGVSKSWKAMGKSLLKEDEEEGTTLSEIPHYLSKVHER